MEDSSLSRVNTDLEEMSLLTAATTPLPTVITIDNDQELSPDIATHNGESKEAVNFGAHAEVPSGNNIENNADRANEIGSDSRVTPPCRKDVECLKQRYLDWVADYRSVVAAVEEYRGRVTHLEAEARRMADERRREKEVMDDLTRDRTALMERLEAALQVTPRLAAAEKKNYEMAMEMAALKAEMSEAAREAEARMKAVTKELEEERVAARKESAAAKEAWQKERDKRDAAHQAGLQQVRQAAEREMVRSSFCRLSASDERKR